MQLYKKQTVKAFTLIELLVVIAIISLLVSILLPSLQKARDLAKAVVCSSNLRGIGFEINMYAQDYDGVVPGPSYAPFYRHDYASTYFVGRLLMMEFHDDKLPGNYTCPTRLSVLPDGIADYMMGFHDIDGVGARPWGYASGTGERREPWRLSRIENPASDVAMFDIDCEVYPMPGYLPASPIHNDARNNLFFDWHVERY